MRRKWTIGVTIAASLVAATLVAPASPAAAKAYEMSDPQDYIVSTKHGDIFVQAIHPMNNGKIVKGPAILTYSPYSVLGRNGDAGRWVPRGYSRIYADVVGTGNSGGCWDYGGKREQETGAAVVEWIAKQKWSTGKVGMVGGSYDGTTQNMIAVTKTPSLTTIVPTASISRWYGYAFEGGIRFAYTNEPLGNEGASAVDDEGADTPLAFDFGLAIPPPIDGGENWAERVQSTILPCDELEHSQHGYDDTPDYDKFWLERDYLKDAGKVEIPVLVNFNWGDWNVKQQESYKLFQALTNSEKRVLYAGSRYDDHGGPADPNFSKAVDDWMDHYLMGVDNGIEKMPTVVSQTANYDEAGKFIKGTPKVTNVVLMAQETPPTGGYSYQLLPQKPQLTPGLPPEPVSFPSTSINAESHALHHARMNHDWYWFEAPSFKKDVRIFGRIQVQVWSRVNREWVTFTPTIADVDPATHIIVPPAGHVANTSARANVGLTRGWLDSRYRNGLDKQVPLTPNKEFGMTIDMMPTDYTFKKGNFVGLNVQTEINEWHLPKLYPCDSEVPPPTDTSKTCPFVNIFWDTGKTRIILPVVNAPKNPASLFDIGHQH